VLRVGAVEPEHGRVEEGRCFGDAQLASRDLFGGAVPEADGGGGEPAGGEGAVEVTAAMSSMLASDRSRSRVRAPATMASMLCWPSSRAFTAASVAQFALGAANFGGMIFMPLYLQIVRGEDVILAGLLVAPTGLGALLSAPFIDRYAPGITAFTGAVILAVSTIPFVFLTATTPYLLLCLVMVIRGVGFGLSIIPAMTAAYQACRRTRSPTPPRSSTSSNASAAPSAPPYPNLRIAANK
jgi:MFS family permease